MDFADDMSLVSDGIKEAQKMFTRVEYSATQVGISMNEGKTKYISYNPINILKSSYRCVKYEKCLRLQVIT